jgi:hypothetical protein
MTVKKYRKAGLGKPHRLRALCSHREDKNQAVCWLGGTAVLELAASGSAARAVPFDLTNTGSRPPTTYQIRSLWRAGQKRRQWVGGRARQIGGDLCGLMTPAEAARVFLERVHGSVASVFNTI